MEKYVFSYRSGEINKQLGKLALSTKRAFRAVDIYRCSLFVWVTVFVTWLDNWNIVDYADKQQRKPICSYI